MKVSKVIIPAAGFGTRFLPQTKAMPKEMLPIVDKPVIQYVVEEALSGGVSDVIIVTGWHKRAIEDHFDYSFELEKRLEEWGKAHLIESVRDIANAANYIYVRQKGPYGTATPIKCCKHLVGDEPFLMLWGDEIMEASPSRAQQVIKAFDKYQATILAAMITDRPQDTKKYAYAKGTQVDSNIWKLEEIIEKPGPDKAPSNIALPSGYVLTSDIFPILDDQKPGLNGEYYLAEALNELAKSKPVYAVVLENAKYYDTGNKLEYIKTVLEFSLKHEDIKEDLKQYLIDNFERLTH